MPKRICKTPHWYDGRNRQVGEQFDVLPQDIKVELALDHIERADDDPDIWPHGQAYATREMTARVQGRRQHARKGA